MRNTFIKTLTDLAEKDSRLLLLTGDLGYTVVEPFAEKFPDRFYNVGVAEQNMVGLATGLAEAGFIPFLYSIATFASLRPYEFIRNGPVLHRLPVRIVGVGGGFEYGFAGITHHALEDVGVMRLQPELAVIAPADYQQTRTALLQTWNLPGPIYYRLGKDDRTSLSGLEGKFELGRANIIGRGTDLLLIAMGSVSSEALAAAEILSTYGLNCTVMIVASFNPAPVGDIIETAACFRTVLTVEDHYHVGGLGSLIAEIVAEYELGCRVVRCGVKSNPNELIGSQRYLRHKYGLSCERLVQLALQELQPQKLME